MAWFCRSCGYELADTKKEVLKLGKCSQCGGTKVKRVREGEPVLNVGIGQKIEKGESPTRKRDKAVHGTIRDLFPVTKTKAEETVSIDEAVSYGFEMFKGIFKYVIVLFILGVITFLIMFASINSGEPAIGLLAIPVYVILLILNFSLMIGVFYKLWVDILARSRK